MCDDGKWAGRARIAIESSPCWRLHWCRPSRESPASAETKRLAVLEFRGKDVKPEVLATMSDQARAGALTVRGRNYDVMTRESMAVMLKEMGGSAKCEEGECEVETARNIGAHLVITGEVVLIEGTYIVTLKLHETAKGTLLATQQVEGKSQLDVIDRLESAAEALVRKGLGLGGQRRRSRCPGAGRADRHTGR